MDYLGLKEEDGVVVVKGCCYTRLYKSLCVKLKERAL
jgi:hypothetical protein